MHVVGRGEALLDVAVADAAAMVALVGEPVLAVILVDERRAGLQRLLDVEDRRQHLVVDLDLAPRASRAAAALSARTATICSPLKRTLSTASTGSSFGLDLDQAEDRVDVVAARPCG